MDGSQIFSGEQSSISELLGRDSVVDDANVLHGAERCWWRGLIHDHSAGARSSRGYHPGLHFGYRRAHIGTLKPSNRVDRVLRLTSVVTTGALSFERRVRAAEVPGASDKT